MGFDPGHWADLLRMFRTYVWLRFSDMAETALTSLGPWAMLAWEVLIYLALFVGLVVSAMVLEVVLEALMGHHEDRQNRRIP